MKRRFPQANLHYHEWVQYADRIGTGYCEPEAFIVLKDFVFLLECKLTGGVAGKLQLTHLYKPILEHIFKREVRCLLICKHISTATPGPFVASLEEFLLGGKPFATWHWLPEP